MTHSDTLSWREDEHDGGMLNDAEVRQLHFLSDQYETLIAEAKTESEKSEAGQRAELAILQQLQLSGDPLADVKAHAVAQGFIQRDAKYRVMLSWINRWAETILKTQRFGPFTAMTRLGSGGFGMVFKARHGSRYVAVKLAWISRMPSDRQTLKATALQHLNFFIEAQRHANIKVQGCVPLFEAKEGIPEQLDVDSVLRHLRAQPIWFSMQLIEGKGSVRDWMTSNYKPGETISSEEVLDLMVNVGEILQRLHSQVPQDQAAADDGYFIHKDLKPENILVDERRDVWLGDFGLATPRASQSVFGNRISGTRFYMAPEQFGIGNQPNFVNAQTDIWAWGVVFYELLTGQMPFMGKTWGELREAIEHSHPDCPSSKTHVPIPAYLDAIILKCLRVNRSGDHARYGSFQEILQDLREQQRRDLQKVSLLEIYRPLRWALLAIATCVALAFCWIAFQRSRDQRDQNERLARIESLLEASKRLSPELLVDLDLLRSSGDSRLKTVAEQALRRHQWAEAIDFFSAKSAASPKQAAPVVALVGSFSKLLPEIHEQAEKARTEVFNCRDQLPDDYRQALLRALDDTLFFSDLLFAYLDKYVTNSSSQMFRNSLELLGGAVTGVNVLAEGQRQIQESSKQVMDSVRKCQDLAVFYGARNDWPVMPEVTSLTANGYASKHGIKMGDLLFKVDGEVVSKIDANKILVGRGKSPISVTFLTVQGIKEFSLTNATDLGAQFSVTRQECPVGLVIAPPNWPAGYVPTLVGQSLDGMPISNISLVIEDRASGKTYRESIPKLTTPGSVGLTSIWYVNKQCTLTIEAPGYLPRVIDLSKHLE